MGSTSRVLMGILLLVVFMFIGLTDTGLNDFIGGTKNHKNEIGQQSKEFINPDVESPFHPNGFDDVYAKNKEGNSQSGDSSSLEELEEYGLSRVIDGDTILVIDNKTGKEERVRLLLIDTPESVHPNGLVEAYGVEASNYAKEYFKGVRKVHLDIGKNPRDKYDRLLAHVFVDGENFNLHMVEKGYARIAYVYEPNTKYLEKFEKAEQKAKKAKRNVWSIDGYVTDKGFDMSVVDDSYEEAS